MISFNTPPIVGTEANYIAQALSNQKLSGDGPFNRKCQQWMQDKFQSPLALLTPSCTASLEMAAILIDLQPGDEVIMPSYTFVSTANAFVLRGAKIVFVDIRPDTMNIDENKIKRAITSKTKAIVPVHYAGVACEMAQIMAIAKQYNLWVIEDAAQGVMSTYEGKALGTIGHIGCFSFHETKNYTSGGEGGAILIQDETLLERAEIIREKGTDRSQFCKGQVDKYTWQDVGSSFLLSELQAAYLFAQFEAADTINQRRLAIWQQYYQNFTELARINQVNLPTVPDNCQHNAHMFYLKLANIQQRSDFIGYLKENNVSSVFHYIPLHSSPAGLRFGSFCDQDQFTTQESQCLVRLPLYYQMTNEEVAQVTTVVKQFFT
jgi:dTDP-4-amino-4,6-dideoxygalactose transaminase